MGQRENNVQGNEPTVAQEQPEGNAQNVATPAKGEHIPNAQTDPNQANSQQETFLPMTILFSLL